MSSKKKGTTFLLGKKGRKEEGRKKEGRKEGREVKVKERDCMWWFCDAGRRIEEKKDAYSHKYARKNTIDIEIGVNLEG